MSIFTPRQPIQQADDASLVMASLGGDRDAYCEIVSRYQNLLCSLAYSSVGDIKHSEDIAQEAFVEGWKKLDTLRDPQKLKSWLCGILRFKISHYRRKETAQPVQGAEELGEHKEQACHQPELEDAAISEQQQQLMWTALENMEDTYREPLVLFYREQQSIERVATELELSEDTVKQRLSRGRKLLKRAMSVFVEEALVKSKPGVAFTAGVLAAITSIAPPSAQAAAWGIGAAKAGSLFNWLSIVAFIGTFSGFISTFLGLRTGLAQARTDRERQFTIRLVGLFMLLVLIYVFGLLGLRSLAVINTDNALLFAVISQLLVLGYALSHFVLVGGMFRRMQQLRAQQRIFHPEAFTRPVDKPGAKQREHISRFRLFGIPLFHFQLDTPEKGDKPAVGWFAGGAHAYGVLFAWGGVAVAPISVGIVSFGVLSVGVVGIGLLGVGTIGIGIIGFGASAIAYKAYGSLSALGWESAFSNGFSIAKEAALGPVAFAEHINNEQAAEIVNLTLLDQSYQWVLALIAVLVVLPALWYSRKVRQRLG